MKTTVTFFFNDETLANAPHWEFEGAVELDEAEVMAVLAKRGVPEQVVTDMLQYQEEHVDGYWLTDYVTECLEYKGVSFKTAELIVEFNRVVDRAA